MTDLIKRLRAEVDPDVNEPLDRLLEDAANEIERLKALVRSAYNEGFNEGMREHTSYNGGKPWRESKTCRSLTVIHDNSRDAT